MELEDLFPSERFVWFSSSDLKRMADMYQSGSTTYGLSGVFGIDPRAVCRRLLAMGIKLRGRGRKSILSDDQCLELLLEKEKTGKSIRVISLDLKVSDRTVCEYLFRARSLLKRNEQARQ